MKKLWAVIEVLYCGKQLANPAAWKKLQFVVTTLGTIVGGLVALSPKDIGITDAGIAHVAEAIAIIGTGIVNAYLIPATTDKIGIKKKQP